MGNPLTAPRLMRRNELPVRPRGEVWSDDELLKLSSTNTDIKFELRDGEIIAMPPAGYRHGAVITRLILAIASHVDTHKLGTTLEGQTGYRLSLQQCIAPDVSFVAKDRYKLLLPDADKYFQGAPDLAVEVLSPSDSITETERKLALFLTHGTHLAWMVDPRRKWVRVYRKLGEFELLSGNQHLTGNSVLPGFRLSLHRLFEEL